jgi:2-amino-4-hydroxy-6-hydroxymethyldihydropteridine diphosphokinase
VVEIATELAPRALLRKLHAIEARAGRVRAAGERNRARTLDLDLLLYGRRRIASPRLTVPHPRMHERAFVLRPLADIAPHATIPGRGRARSLLRPVAGQRIARTRSHVLH